MKYFNVDLLKGNVLKSLLIFTIPLLLSNVFQQLYNSVDTMIVGMTLGPQSLAAIGASAAVFELLVGFALGVGNGFSIVVARSFGSGDEERVKRSVAASITSGFLVIILVMLLGHFFLYDLLEILNTPPEIIVEAYSYISFITQFIAVMFAYNLLAGLLRAIGNSVMPLVFLIISSLLNVGLDVVFIVNLNMGIRGAAVATVISQGISAIFCLIYIFKRCPMLVPSRRHFTLDKPLYLELLGQGISMGFMLSIVSIGTVILQTSINGFGYMIIAGHTIARKLNSFFMIPVASLSLSLSTFVSQNKGANQGIRIRQAVRYSNILAFIWGLLVTVVLFFASTTLIQVFSGSNEPVIIENGRNYLLWNVPFFGVLGVLLNLRNALQGLNIKLVPLISSIIELVMKILFVWLIIPGLGYFGVIICEPIIWFVMCAQLIYAFYRNPFIVESKAASPQLR